MVGNGGQTFGIVDGGKIGKLGLPAATAFGEVFALGFESFDPLLLDGGFVETALKGAVAVVIFGHGSDVRGFEKVFDLRVGQLAHETGQEATAFFADGGIAEAVVSGETLTELRLADRAIGFIHSG